ncbi:MAG: fluoride efflux transporter CrcB [Myxococcota bacterium]
MQNAWLLVALGGALGAVLRYGAGRLSVHLLGPSWPFGTLFVNVVGSLALGFVVGLSERAMPASTRTFLGTGMLGAFTTFSTFSVETVGLAERGEVIGAIGNVVANTALGLTAAVLGLWLARAVSDA